MRIITGSARGRRLTAPEGTDVRPTAEVTKEAVFSAIHFEVEGARMLDLFAGTGQMGLEAISRGAKSVTFVESGRPSLEHCVPILRHAVLQNNARCSLWMPFGF